MVSSSQSPRQPAAPTRQAPTRKLEILVGRFLFWGGLLSILIVCVGFGLHLVTGAAGEDHDLLGEVTARPTASAEGPAPGVFVSAAAVLQGLRRRPIDPLAVVALGLMLLLATPVLALALAVPGFAAVGDYRYLAISLLILAILAAGILAGAGA
jgi:uncharacterized membrane protein